jgi:hypothetical protein
MSHYNFEYALFMGLLVLIAALKEISATPEQHQGIDHA